jgi:integrase
MRDDESTYLADRMSSYLEGCRATSTMSKYTRQFKDWERFVTDKGGCALPGNSIHFALYITFLLETGKSVHVIQGAVCAVKFMHSLHDFPDPTDNGFVKKLVESSKRRPRKPTVRKDPINSDMLIELCNMYRHSHDVSIVRDLTMIVLGFSAFLRFDELSSLQCSDLHFYDDHFKIVIQKSKTDVYRHVDEILVYRGETVACPYNLLQRYIRLADLSLESHEYLFRPMYRSKQGCKLIGKNKKLSYTRARECIVSRLKLVTGANIGLHSMRAGGASAAANANVIDRCWKRHGRWSTDSAKDRYVVDSLSRRLEVSKSLKL